MRSVWLLREVLKREALMTLGENPHSKRITQAQNSQFGRDRDTLQCPEDVDEKEAVQAADGSFYFTIDMTALDIGTDVLQ